MNIRMLSLEDGARQATGTVIIIDVFRAFTVEAAGFSRGVKNFILTEDVDQAIAWRKKGIGKYVIGEVGGEKPIEFDFPNSPRPFIDNETKFIGETMIHRSSSGTCGVCWAAPQADQIYAACFNNAEATYKIYWKTTLKSSQLLLWGLEVASAQMKTNCARITSEAGLKTANPILKPSVL